MVDMKFVFELDTRYYTQSFGHQTLSPNKQYIKPSIGLTKKNSNISFNYVSLFDKAQEFSKQEKHIYTVYRSG